MKRHSLLIATLLLAALGGFARDPKTSRPVIAAPGAYERLKTLVGEWESETSMGKARLSYEVIAGGTALVEREAIGKEPPMLTVYTLDGSRLLLTHFCMAGNQPRMQAQAFDPATGVLEFRFLDATNLASPAAGHMHNARFRFVDPDHLETAWEFYESGKKKFGETAVYTRVK